MINIKNVDMVTFKKWCALCRDGQGNQKAQRL